jgi:hypothetical protein
VFHCLDADEYKPAEEIKQFILEQEDYASRRIRNKDRISVSAVCGITVRVKIIVIESALKKCIKSSLLAPCFFTIESCSGKRSFEKEILFRKNVKLRFCIFFSLDPMKGLENIAGLHNSLEPDCLVLFISLE